MKNKLHVVAVWLLCSTLPFAPLVADAQSKGTETTASSAADPPALPPYVYAPSVDPNGIGKFYFGREIAHFMTYHGADWLVREDREETEQPDKLLDELGIEPGDTVADVGAGVGYFSLRIAGRVGPQGRVLAVDIQKEMLRRLAENQKTAGLKNIRPVLGTITDPKLPAGEVDLVLMVDVYHEFSHPVEMLRAIRRSLKPDGRVVFVEYRGEDPAVPIKLVHKMTEAQVRLEAESVGLVWLETLDFLPTQHVILFGPDRERHSTP
jgi:SAM-dependent methyltransferase